MRAVAVFVLGCVMLTLPGCADMPAGSGLTLSDAAVITGAVSAALSATAQARASQSR